MADEITKKDLGELGTNLVEAMDFRFQATNERIGRLEQRMEAFEVKLDKLTETLDHFLKRLTDFEDEFVIMKSEMRRLKEVIKEKLGVDIDTKS